MFRSATSVAPGSAATAAPAVPTGAASGDIAVVCIYKESTAAITPPTGFTQKAALTTSATARGSLYVFWKRLTAADTGTYSFSWTGSAFRGAACALFSGRTATGDPFSDFGTAESTTAVSTLNVSCAPAVASCDLVAAWTNFTETANWTPPAGFTERVDTLLQTIDTQDAAASGSTGNVAATYGTTGFMKGFIGALAPAAGGAFTDGASATETATIGAAGSTGVTQTASVAETATIAATGATGVNSGGNVTPVVAIGASGTTGIAGAATITETVSIGATGSTGVTGTAARAATITITATGAVTSGGHDAPAITTVGITATGATTATRNSADAETVSIGATGTVASSSSGAQTFAATIGAAGTVGTAGAAHMQLAAPVAATGASDLVDTTVTARIISAAVTIPRTSGAITTPSATGSAAAPTVRGAVSTQVATGELHAEVEGALA